MPDIGFTSPAMMRRVVAATKRVEAQKGRGLDQSTQWRGERSIVRNVSSHEIPRFGLMQVKQTVIVDKVPIIEVERPFSTTIPGSIVLVNGIEPIAAGALGSPQIGPEFIIKTNGSSTPVGSRIGWTADSFLASPGCLFTVIGINDMAHLESNLVRAVFDQSVITGTVTTAIPASLGGLGVVTTTSPTQSYPAETDGAAISVGSLVVMMPRKGRWLALEVCG